MSFMFDEVKKIYTMTVNNINDLENFYATCGSLLSPENKKTITCQLEIYRNYEQLLHKCIIMDNKPDTNSGYLQALKNNLLLIASKYKIEGAHFVFRGSLSVGISIEHNVFDSHKDYKNFYNESLQMINIFSALLQVPISFKYGGR